MVENTIEFLDTELDDQDMPNQDITSFELLLLFMQNPDNIAEELKDDILGKIATSVLSRFEEDEGSMSDWKQAVDWGQKLAQQEMKPRMLKDGAAWEGSANFKTPLIKEAGIKFASRASTEILRHKDLVKSEVIGKDPEGTRKERGERVKTHMNYQINHTMDWRAMHDKMLYELPSVGVVFKKSFFNQATSRNETELIHYPNFVVNQDVSSIEEARSFTQILTLGNNAVTENIRAGLWLDAELNIDDDKEDEFIEQHGSFDLDDDGYEEPYLITLHKSSSTVVRIVPRYTADDVIIKTVDGSMHNLGDLSKEFDMQEAIESGEVNPEDVEIVRIKPISMITKYGFIPADDGSFLDLGYFHILGSLSAGINTTTNQLIDAGTLANMPSGLISKAFRKAKHLLRFKPGEFKPTDIDSVDLQQGIYTFPFKGADQTLFALNQDITQQARNLSASPDFNQAAQANAPATTTLALLQEQMSDTSAIISRIHRSMSEEYSVLFRLNGIFTDPEEYRDILNDPQADFRLDYSEENIDIAPTANPEMSSKMERLVKAEVMISQAPLISQSGGSILPLLNRFFDDIGEKELGVQIFEQTEGQASAQQQIEQQQQQITLQGQEQTQTQLDQTERLLAVQEREQDRKDAATANDIDVGEIEQDRKNIETLHKNLVSSSEALLRQSQTLLNAEKTETEMTNNDLNVFTTQFKAALDAVNLQEGIFSARQNAAGARRLPPGGPGI